LSDLFRDLKHTLRRLARTPLFTLATVLTLALGIGANTAIFSVIHSVLLKPLPFPEPGLLIGVWQTAPGVNIKDLNASLADYITYREDSKVFADVALWNRRSVTVTEFADPERVDGINATFRLLPILGVRPVLGREFTEKDNENSSPEVVMLGHGYWKRRFGGDPKVIGRRIMVDGSAREIVGVLPESFWFMDAPHDLVLPLRFERANVRLAGYNWQAIARLRPGVTLPQADADVARMIAIELRGKFPPPNGMSLKMMEDARLGPNVRLLMDDLLGDIGRSLWVVMATIGIVLLIACANVANLLLVRTEGRAQELAVRGALGAGRGRIAFELFVESLALALMGGVAGIGFAVGVVKLVLRMSPARLPRFEQISVDSTAILFTLVISLAAGFAFGAIPV
jgi:predicted permease